jgi:hypothetical protein
MQVICFAPAAADRDDERHHHRDVDGGADQQQPPSVVRNAARDRAMRIERRLVATAGAGQGGKERKTDRIPDPESRIPSHGV